MALSDPDAEIDEIQVSRQKERVRIFEAALEKAIDEAAGQIQKLEKITGELNRLTTLTYLGGRKGLESLAG